MARLCVWVHCITMTELGTPRQGSGASHPGEPNQDSRSPVYRRATCQGDRVGWVVHWWGEQSGPGAAQLVEEVRCSTQGDGRAGTPLTNMVRQALHTAGQSSRLVLHGPQFRSTELLPLVCVSRGFSS